MLLAFVSFFIIRVRRGAKELIVVESRDTFFRFVLDFFSTPIIDASGKVYFGSADHYFYALNPDGSLNWKYETGEIIDSAGALFDAAPGSQEAPLVFISGDGNMYGFNLAEGSTDN